MRVAMLLLHLPQAEQTAEHVAVAFVRLCSVFVVVNRVHTSSTAGGCERP